MLSLQLVRRVLPLLALGVVAAEGASAQVVAPLSGKVYNADANSFHVNAVGVSGKSDAMVIDTGFTRADALRVAANVLDSGKVLKTIFISNADPDFYFGAETLKELFPQARVVTTPAVREKIQASSRPGESSSAHEPSGAISRMRCRVGRILKKRMRHSRLPVPGSTLATMSSTFSGSSGPVRHT